MLEKDKNKIIKDFMEGGIKILDADFGIAWWRSTDDKDYQLVYKSPNFPYKPPHPREKAGNYIARKTKKPFFDSDIKSENYEFKIRKYLKSYIIIPIFHQDQMYGSLVFCYKNRHVFTKDEVTLSNIIGNTAAQAITVHRLLKTDVLLSEERRRNEFIANATHELRTPLAIIRGYIDLALLEKKKSKSIPHTLRIVNSEINHLAEILKDLELMTVSGSHTKNITDFKPVDVQNLIKTISKRLKPLATQKNIVIKVKTAKSPETKIFGDKMYLEKLFLNLIKNAISYGKVGGNIEVQISKSKSMVNVVVSDNGIGISKEDLPKIFQRFYRADKSHSESHSGLGLAIVKWAAGVHGGKVSVKSVKGKGSVFTVLLPAQAIK